MLSPSWAVLPSSMSSSGGGLGTRSSRKLSVTGPFFVRAMGGIRHLPSPHLSSRRYESGGGSPVHRRCALRGPGFRSRSGCTFPFRETRPGSARPPRDADDCTRATTRLSSSIGMTGRCCPLGREPQSLSLMHFWHTSSPQRWSGRSPHSTGPQGLATWTSLSSNAFSSACPRDCETFGVGWIRTATRSWRAWPEHAFGCRAITSPHRFSSESWNALTL